MAEPLPKPAEETAWYENHQPIQEFLDGYKKSPIRTEDPQDEELSWIKIVNKSKKE